MDNFSSQINKQQKLVREAIRTQKTKFKRQSTIKMKQRYLGAVRIEFAEFYARNVRKPIPLKCPMEPKITKMSTHEKFYALIKQVWNSVLYRAHANRQIEKPELFQFQPNMKHSDLERFFSDLDHNPSNPANPESLTKSRHYPQETTSNEVINYFLFRSGLETQIQDKIYFRKWEAALDKHTFNLFVQAQKRFAADLFEKAPNENDSDYSENYLYRRADAIKMLSPGEQAQKRKEWEQRRVRSLFNKRVVKLFNHEMPDDCLAKKFAMQVAVVRDSSGRFVMEIYEPNLVKNIFEK